VLSADIKIDGRPFAGVNVYPLDTFEMDSEDYQAGWRMYSYTYIRFQPTREIHGRVKHLESNGPPALLKEVFEDIETRGAM